MLKRIVLAALLCIGANSALAMAYAEIDLGTFGKLTLHETGYNYIYEWLPLPGDVVDVPYTITVHDDGLAAGSIPPFCLGIFGGPCSPNNHGYELATVELVVGYRDPRSANPWFITFGGGEVILQTHADGVGETLSQTGVIHIGGFMLEDPPEPPDQVSLYAVAFVASNPLSPIPEPETYAVLLIGVAAIVARRRRIAT
jgi:hypothetical protein